MRGVGFEPTKAYATGFPRSPVIPRDHLSLAPSDFEVAPSCPLDLVPAWLVSSPETRVPPRISSCHFSLSRILPLRTSLRHWRLIVRSIGIGIHHESLGNFE